MATRIKPDTAELYRSDFYLWALEQARLLRAERFHEVDLEHLAEEVEGLAAANWNAVRSHARNIIEHLLKLQYSPAQEPRNAWRHTVRMQRQQLEDVLTPTLRRDLENDLGRQYARTRRVLDATLRDYGEHRAADALPAECPYTLDEILGDWLPEPSRDQTEGRA